MAMLYPSTYSGEPPKTLDPEADTDLHKKIRKHLSDCETEYVAYATLCKSLDEAYKPSRRVPETYAWEVNLETKKLDHVRTQIPLVFTAVNLKSNVLGMRPPKFNVRPLDRRAQDKRRQGQFIESLIEKVWADEDMDEAHLNNARCLGLYGRSIYHDGIRNGQTFTENIDQQYNVWVSYRRLGEPECMSFVELVSEQEAMDLGWDGMTVDATMRVNFPVYGAYPHDDPLGIKTDRYRGEKFILGKVPVIHFYYQKKKYGNVFYCRVVNGQITQTKDLKRKDWPFTIVECEHVPGLTSGTGDAEPLLDFQAELNGRASDWGEAIRRQVKDQWKAWGLRHLTPKHINGGGRVWELTDKDTDDIQPLAFPADDQGAQAYLNFIMEQYRRVSGIPAEAEAGQVAAGTSGFMATIKYQALITSLAPRRIRYEKAYKKWALSKLERLKQIYPEYADLLVIEDFILDVDWEEIAPRDVAMVMNTLAQGVSTKMLSRYSAMEQLQMVPEDEMALIAEEMMNPYFDPQGAMAGAQAQLMLQQVAAQAMAGQGGQNLPFFEQQGREQALNGIAAGTPERNQYNPPQGRQMAPGAAQPVNESVGGRLA